MNEGRIGVLREQLRQRMLSQMNLERDATDEEILSEIRREIVRLCGREGLTIPQRTRLEREVFHSLRRLDLLEDLLEEEGVTEIMINGPDRIFLERDGRILREERSFSSSGRLEDVIQQIVAAHNQAVNETEPIVDTRLADGSRVCIVLPPVSIDHATVCIRRFSKKPMDMDRLLSLSMLSGEMADFLKSLVISGYNIFISGGTGSGKTTFLNALSGYVPSRERVVTIEDAAELSLQGIENLVRLEARSATANGGTEVTIRQLVRTALRLRPDRIIVGECRGGEALEVLQAANTGHDGTLSTGHANSPQDMISRLETMVLMAGVELPLPAIRRQIASGIDLFVQVGRLRDGRRRVLEIAEVLGMESGEIRLATLYGYDSAREAEGGDPWIKQAELTHTEKLRRNRG